MNNYKEASRLKLRIQTPRGPLAPEQLWDLKLDDLATVAKTLYEEKKKFGNSESEELSFLEGMEKKQSRKEFEVNLSFELVKDVYETKMKENKDAITDLEKKKEKNHILELIQRKKDQELEGKSVEELEKMLKDLDK